MPGVYVHLPFCPYVCPYCDFAKWPVRASSARRYLDALHAQIQREPPVQAETMYLGGGTPNAYDAATVTRLVSRLRERFGDANEISIEVNPELVREGDFSLYRQAGISRLSIGVQSFDDAEIRVLGRKHAPEDVAFVVAQARDAGFASVSLDLMFGIPGQTLRSWKGSLDRAVALQVDHVSAYGLTVEEGTPYRQWQMREPSAFFDDASEADFYEMGIAALRDAGYEQYEISNFARPGHRCAHNENYWANGDYVGLGVGAASYRGGVRSTWTRSLEEYVEAAIAGTAIPSEDERLEGDARAGEAIMLALRTARGVHLTAFNERYGIDLVQRYAAEIDRLTRAGLVEWADDCMRLTERGRFVANDVCGAFLTFE